jgi:hypothetical protein
MRTEALARESYATVLKGIRRMVVHAPNENDPLTPEEEALKKQFEDEDAGRVPFERIEAALLIPLPEAEDDVVAVILPFTKVVPPTS